MSGPRPEVSAANRRRWAARAAETLTPKPVVVEGSLLAAAKAERGTGQPLAVESLEEKLERAIPGAWVAQAFSGSWCVYGPERRVGNAGRQTYAATKREAVAKAIALFGGGR